MGGGELQQLNTKEVHYRLSPTPKKKKLVYWSSNSNVCMAIKKTEESDLEVLQSELVDG